MGNSQECDAALKTEYIKSPPNEFESRESARFSRGLNASIQIHRLESHQQPIQNAEVATSCETKGMHPCCGEIHPWSRAEKHGGLLEEGWEAWVGRGGRVRIVWLERLPSSPRHGDGV